MIKNIINGATGVVGGVVSTVTKPIRDRNAKQTRIEAARKAVATRKAAASKRSRAATKAAETRKANSAKRASAAKRAGATRSRRTAQTKSRVDAMVDAVKRD